ncbi:MAG: DUF5615 family PIN-like protein [Chloroflexi bacterium]|nr:DUF5615 family PIN-like protein [Chloroflexota bacterium]
MRLCVDEDVRSEELLNRLRNAGHDVVILEKGLADQEVWDFAQWHDAPVLTRNADDFIGLARSGAHHAGLLIVLAEGDATRDMKPGAIARAIDRIDKRNPAGLRNVIVVVNQHRS